MIIPEAHRLSKVKTYYFARKLAEIDQMNQDGNVPVINLGIGSPDINPPASVVNAIQEASDLPGVNKYQSYRGIPELRAAFSNWYKRHFQVEMDDHSEILPLIGSKEGIMHISMAFLNPGDQVLVPNPGYPAYTAVSEICQAEIRHYDLKEKNNWLPDLEALEAQDLSKVKIMWINYPHMPTGATATIAFFEKVVAFAKRNDILICHDNPYTFILNNDPVSIMQVEGAKEVALELTSLSKNYNMAGWRVGAVAGHADLINSILKFKSNMDSGMHKPIQLAAVEALNLTNEWHQQLNTQYEERRNYAWKIMDLVGCSYDKNASGLFIWGRIPDDVDHAETLSDAYLYDARVFITPGHIFGSIGEKYLRISLCADLDALTEAHDRIVQVLKPEVL
ncbi:MAG: aminotransferase class I/II-fold pyridoxal phosphate-dependent enzyme [Saprospiraceae bacterium]|nr:aminotransferase class I/II-fold pyridoxal phosphate-dependent enzyme [Saprospiraceae bacterium]